MRRMYLSYNNKFNDFRVAQETINTIRERLGHAFLLSSRVVRNADRVIGRNTDAVYELGLLWVNLFTFSNELQYL